MECEQTFTNWDTYIKHTAEHATHSLVCPLCKIKFETVEDVEFHIEEHAIAEEHFACTICSSSYLTETLLKDHLMEYHEGTIMLEEHLEPEEEEIGEIVP